MPRPSPEPEPREEFLDCERASAGLVWLRAINDYGSPAAWKGVPLRKTLTIYLQDARTE